VVDAMYDRRNVRTLAFAAVKSNFVEARRTLFSEPLTCAGARRQQQSAARRCHQTFGQKYGLRKSARLSDSFWHHDGTAHGSVAASGLRPEVVVYPDSNDIACC
jgi:hypothetical protein